MANNAITKGDVLAAARVAGIQAAKRTADLVPMCHPLLVGSVQVDFTIGDDYVEVEAKVETVDRTGVEMEAMTACAIAALTVYDMCKTADRTMSIGQLMLWEKTGRQLRTVEAGAARSTAEGSGGSVRAAGPDRPVVSGSAADGGAQVPAMTAPRSPRRRTARSARRGASCAAAGCPRD